MGEIAHVDLDRLRAVAGRFWRAADEVAAMFRPELDPDDLPGSAVDAAVSADLIAGQIGDVVSSLNGWALAARTSAEALQHADAANGDRFVPR